MMHARTMLTLPPIMGRYDCALPLCDATAMAIAMALVDKGNLGALASSMASDPPFAIWCVAASTPKTERERTIDSLVHALEERLPSLLVWTGLATTTFTSDQHSQ